MLSGSVGSSTPYTVLRMRIGGSAGLSTITALPLDALPIFSRPRAVVSVNSSMFCRVPGPALLLAIVATISAYSTGAHWPMALTSGTVACPPQLTRLTLGSPTWASRLTIGMT